MIARFQNCALAIHKYITILSETMSTNFKVDLLKKRLQKAVIMINPSLNQHWKIYRKTIYHRLLQFRFNTLKLASIGKKKNSIHNSLFSGVISQTV